MKENMLIPECTVRDMEKKHVKDRLAKAKGFIFDMDGLMIDSEPLHYKSLNMVFSNYGKCLSESDYEKFVGLSDEKQAPILIKELDLPLTPERLLSLKGSTYLCLLRQYIPSQVGLYELLNKLQTRGVKKAIATNSTTHEAETIVGTLGIGWHFNTIVASDQVNNPKPDPEMLIIAADRIGLAPRECVMLEDGLSGIRAANSIGMMTIAIPSRETVKSDFSIANLCLSSLSNLVRYL